MNVKRIIKVASAIVITALAVFSCFSIQSIILPSKIEANSEFEVIINGYLTPQESDYTTSLIAMVCVPKGWDAQNTATATFSTDGYAASHEYKDMGITEIIDEEMLPITDDLLEPTTGLPYPEALHSKYQDAGNFGDVEWIGFVSKNEHYFTDISSRDLKGFAIPVKIKFKTTDVNYKFFLGAWLGGKLRGFGHNDWGSVPDCTDLMTTVVEVTGGSSKENYTVPDMVSTVPVEFRFGDFFQVNFSTDLEGAESVLKGEDKVYLCGKAILSDGTEVTVDKPVAKNLMAKNGGMYSKYILPAMFFNIDYSKKISKMFVWFTNADGSVTDYCMGEEGWEFSQASNE